MKGTVLFIVLILATVIMPIATFGYRMANHERIARFCETEADVTVVFDSILLGLFWPLYVSYKIFDTSTDKDQCS
jgi:hypothetical protein